MVLLVGAIVGLLVAAIVLGEREQEQGTGMIGREEWLVMMGERMQEWRMMAAEWRLNLLPRFPCLAVDVDFCFCSSLSCSCCYY